jgi:Tol biopolymer transport system component
MRFEHSTQKPHSAVATMALTGLLIAGLLSAAPASATFPGKNGKIAYSFFPGADNFGSTDFELVTIKPGSPFVPLPKQNPRKDNWPDWSPDGRQLVWWHQLPGGHFDVYKMNADGTGQTNLTGANPGDDLNAAWSPDGKEIVLDSNSQTDTGFFEIQVMDSNGQHYRQLTHGGPDFDNFGQFSPDGKRIAYTHGSAGTDESAIYTMDAKDGANQKKLTQDLLFAGNPDWSPDGKRIVFVDNFCGPCPQSDIWVMNADGSDPVRLTNTPTEHEFRPGFSPDGKKITFSNIPLTPEHPFADLPADVYVMNANGTGRRNITNSPDQQDRAPDWGPRPEHDQGQQGSEGGG